VGGPRRRPLSRARHPGTLLLVVAVVAGPVPAAAADPDSPPASAPPLTLAPPGDEARWLAGSEPEANRWVPALESLGFNLGLNLYARLRKPPGNEFDTGPASTWRNIRGPWVYDVDPFGTNEFQHPYQGSVSFTAARSTGNGFYASLLYAVGGSLLWEWAGETEPPSINDQWTTTAAGALLGEVLYRLSNLVLDGGGARPGPWREGAAALLSPATGLNRLAFGNRYREPGLSENPWYGELRLAGAVSGTSEVAGVAGKRDAAVELSARITYGLPAGDWRLRRPFDHFDAQLGLVAKGESGNPGGFMAILVRGLVEGGSFGGGSSRGLWGLFAHYDYMSPAIFRVSSSGIGPGATAQHAWENGLAVAGTALLTAGFGAGGASAEPVGGRDYHFGSTLHALAEGQVQYAGRAQFRLTYRHYLVSGRASPDAHTFESLDYGTAAVVFRIVGRHALAADFSLARRHAIYRETAEVRSRANAVHLSWLYASDTGLGVVRNDGGR